MRNMRSRRKKSHETVPLHSFNSTHGLKILFFRLPCFYSNNHSGTRLQIIFTETAFSPFHLLRREKLRGHALLHFSFSAPLFSRPTREIRTPEQRRLPPKPPFCEWGCLREKKFPRERCERGGGRL